MPTYREREHAAQPGDDDAAVDRKLLELGYSQIQIDRARAFALEARKRGQDRSGDN